MKPASDAGALLTRTLPGCFCIALLALALVVVTLQR